MIRIKLRAVAQYSIRKLIDVLDSKREPRDGFLVLLVGCVEVLDTDVLGALLEEVDDLLDSIAVRVLGTFDQDFVASFVGF
jgi:hypothetical protein